MLTADVPLWRKLLSSDWWWYGEVNPDPASLPPMGKRPKLWRGDAIFMIGLMPLMTLITLLSAELNSRYWIFNRNLVYEGVILTTQRSDRQLLVQLKDTTRLEMGWPIADTLGFKSKAAKSQPTLWAPVMKMLIDGHYRCPGRRLRFYGEPWKFTFRPVIRIWRVDCADINVTLVEQETIEREWTNYLKRSIWKLCGLSLGFSLFFTLAIVHRERKLYVKG